MLSSNNNTIEVTTGSIILAKKRTKGFIVTFNGITIPIAYKTKLPGIISMNDLGKLEDMYIIDKMLCKIPALMVATDTSAITYSIKPDITKINRDNAPPRLVKVIDQLVERFTLTPPKLPIIMLSKNGPTGVVITDSKRKVYLSTPTNGYYRMNNSIRVENIIDAMATHINVGVSLDKKHQAEAMEYLALQGVKAGYLYVDSNFEPLENELASTDPSS